MKIRLFTIGNLNVDYFIPINLAENSETIETPEPRAGGTAFNAAVEFKKRGFEPTIIET